MKKLYFKNGKGERICGILNSPSADSEHCVIAIHGFSSHKDRGIKAVCEELDEAGINSFRIDLDNRGESQPKFADQSISSYKETVFSAREFLKHIGYTKVHLLGSSFGGIISSEGLFHIE